MLLIEKVDALLGGITRRDIEHLTSLQRRKLAWALRRIADIADPPEDTKTDNPRAGVLSALANGERSH